MTKRKQSIIEIDPAQIIVDRESNGRTGLPPDVTDLAASMASRVGQLQPIQVRPKLDGEYPEDERKWVLVFGYSRHAAADLINKDRKKKRRAPFLLQALESRADDSRESLITNITENSKRVGVSPLEDAVNMERLITDFGMKQTEVARLYGVNPSTIQLTRRLAGLPAKLKKRLMDPDDLFKPDAAKEVAISPQPVIDQAMKGKITTRAEIIEATAVYEQSPEGKAEAEKQAGTQVGKDGNKPPPRPSGRPRGKASQRTTGVRSLKKIRQLIEMMRESEDGQTKAFGEALSKWLHGRLNDKPLLKAITKIGAQTASEG